MAYMVFEASLIGIFAFFGNDTVQVLLPPRRPVDRLRRRRMLAVNPVLTYFDINLAAKVLGVFLITEMMMLSLMAFSVVFTGGGPEGWSLASLNPLNGFTACRAR